MTTSKRLKIMAAFGLVFLAGTAPSLAQSQIKIVGSSTVFPFSTSVAERFGRNSEFKTPIVESTGSGGGLKLFCSGSDASTPDITNASRRIKASEVELCAQNGVNDIVEVKIGFDGIVVANSLQSELLELSRLDLLLALAKNIPLENGETIANPFTTWNEINPDFPDIKIEVMGPPPTSGTRDAFVELVLEEGCLTFDWVKQLKADDKQEFLSLCTTVREDGAYIEAGENDNLIVQKLVANPDAFGVFGFSFLDSNTDLVQGNPVEGVMPEFENIADGKYPVSRSLYFYVKKSRVGNTPGIMEFLAEFTADKTWGPDGYLADKGLIPLSDADRDFWASRAANLENLSL